MELWGNLPRDILEIIFKNFSLGDRVRIGAVCKHWNHVLSHVPELPWQILSERPISYYSSPEHSITQVSFESLSDKQIYRFKLPDDCDRGWLCGSSRGWLLMATGDRLNPDLFLWNPLNGSIKDLPPLSTHPCYTDFVEPIRKQRMNNVSRLFNQVQVFSHGSAECVVAAIINNETTYRRNQLSFCMPHDEKWTTYEEDDYRIDFIDFIYHEKIGSVCLLKEGYSRTNTMDSRSGLRLSDCTVPILFFQIHWPCMSERQVLRLVEDTIHENGRVLVVAAKLDRVTKYSCFKGVRGVMGHDCIGQLELSSIGNRTILLGSSGTKSIIISNPGRGIETDCVYLAIDDSNTRRYIREQSVYFLKSKKRKGIYLENGRTPAATSIMGWFEPKILWM